MDMKNALLGMLDFKGKCKAYSLRERGRGEMHESSVASGMDGLLGDNQAPWAI